MEILISSHFHHTDTYTDKWTLYSASNFDIIPYSMSHINHTECSQFITNLALISIAQPLCCRTNPADWTSPRWKAFSAPCSPWKMWRLKSAVRRRSSWTYSGTFKSKWLNINIFLSNVILISERWTRAETAASTRRSLSRQQCLRNCFSGIQFMS